MATRQNSSNGKQKSPRIQVVLPEELCKALAELAEQESRTVSNMAKVLIQEGIKNHELREGAESKELETKKLLEDSQSKLSSAVKESKKIIDQAKNDSEKMVSELELKFENSAKIKKELSLSKIKQMKDEAVREIKNTSVDVAFSASENLIKNSIEKSKLDNLFQKNLEDAKDALKKAGSN